MRVVKITQVLCAVKQNGVIVRQLIWKFYLLSAQVKDYDKAFFPPVFLSCCYNSWFTSLHRNLNTGRTYTLHDQLVLFRLIAVFSTISLVKGANSLCKPCVHSACSGGLRFGIVGVLLLKHFVPRGI